MKKIFTLMFCAGLLTVGNVHAQQIKGDFDKQTNWGVQTGFGGAPDKTFTDMGIVPDGWDALNATQMGLNFPLVFEAEGRAGKGKGVKMMNRKLGAFGIGANSPSYITLGKKWIYADIVGVMSQLLGDKSDPDDSDGGSIGGLDFSYRPDSIAGYYKRIHSTQNPNEIAQIMVYSWIGTCKSYSPIGDGADVTENLEKFPLIDRDVDILGVKNDGKPANGITLISKQIYSIEGDITDWTRIAVPINYLRKENPQKINVILSAADYFNRPNIGAENQLFADDVRFIYNSKLKSIIVDGKALEAFDEDVMEYVLPAVDATKTIVAKAFGKDAKVLISDIKDSKRTITVTDETAAGVKTYTYTLIYRGSPATLTWPSVNQDNCVYGKTIDITPLSDNKTGEFTYEITNPKVAEIVGDNMLHFIGIGEVKVIARQAAAGNFSPSVSTTALTVTVKKAPLTIIANDVERKYTFTADKFACSYVGFRNGDTADNAFSTAPTAAVAPQKIVDRDGKEVEISKGFYVGEYAITPAGAVAANYEISYKLGKLTVTPADAVTIGVKAVKVEQGNDFTLAVDYSKLIGNDKTNPKLVFVTDPTLTVDATKDSPAGTYDITFATKGTLTEAATRNYTKILFADKGTLTITAKALEKPTPDFDDKIGYVDGLPKSVYTYNGYTDILGKCIAYDPNGNLIDNSDKRLSYTVKGTNVNRVFAIDQTTGEYQLWGLETGEFDLILTVKETETEAAVSKTLKHIVVNKKSAIVKPLDLTLVAGDFVNETPMYVRSSDFVARDLESVIGMLSLFDKVCPTLEIETPNGPLTLEASDGADFDLEAVSKLHALTPGKYNFILKGGESSKYDFTFDNTVKGIIFIPAKSVVEIADLDKLVYGYKDPFKFAIKANGAAIKDFTITTHNFAPTAVKGEYKVLTPGIDTITFVIPATATTVKETYSQVLTIKKAQLIITPEDVVCEVGRVVVPREFILNYDGFVGSDDEFDLISQPTAVCQAVDNAKAGDEFSIILTGAEAENYDIVYKEGKFSVVAQGTNVGSTQDDVVRVYAANGNIYVEGKEDMQQVYVYTIQGACVYNGTESVITKGIVENSIYLVKVGSYTTRVLVK